MSYKHLKVLNVTVTPEACEFWVSLLVLKLSHRICT